MCHFRKTEHLRTTTKQRSMSVLARFHWRSSHWYCRHMLFASASTSGKGKSGKLSRLLAIAVFRDCFSFPEGIFPPVCHKEGASQKTDIGFGWIPKFIKAYSGCTAFPRGKKALCCFRQHLECSVKSALQCTGVPQNCCKEACQS